MRVYCNRSQMTSQRVKEQKVRHETKLSSVTVVLYTLWRLLWSITVKNKKYNIRWSRVVLLLFFTRCDVFCDLLRHETKSSGVTVVLYTLWRLLWSITVHTRKNVIYLFYTIKIQMVYWRIFGAWKKKNKSADVIWRGFDAICVCVLQKSRYCKMPHKL